MIWWPTEIPILQYGEISLRETEERDIPNIFSACQDPLIPYFTTVPSPYSFNDADGFIRNIAPKSFLNKTELLFAIVKGHGDSEEFCGLISFHTTNLANHSTELGYWLTKDARGQGIGATAARLITDYGFETMGFRRIEAIVDAANDSSIQLLKSVGFDEEGRMRNKITHRDGEQRDMIIFSKVPQ